MSDSATETRRPPHPDQIAETFQVYEVRRENDQVYYHGVSLVDHDELVRSLWPVFRRAGYEIRHVSHRGEDILIAAPRSTDDTGSLPWTHLVLFGLTVLSTLFAGAMWFHVDVISNPTQIWRGWPFTAAILTVLGLHELGHYALGRYHGVAVTLPYFIPIPTLIGTMGAVIRMKGRIPNRRALFDIGVAGPIAGLVATVVVTAVGLQLSPITVPDAVVQAEDAVQIELGFPPLMEGIAWITGQELYYDDPQKMVHPVVIGGWVGMFVTFLNMIPVGQLDGGHIVRALAADYQETIAAMVPTALFALAGYLYFIRNVAFQSIVIWIFWGGLAAVVAFAGPATPLREEQQLGRGRQVIGILTFILAALCFVPVPIAIVS